MFKAIAGFVIKIKWLVVLLWISLAVVSFLFAPKLSDIMKSNQESFLPDSADSIKASNLYKKLFPEKESNSKMVFVMKRSGGLKGEDKKFAREVEAYIKKNKETFLIGDINSPYSNKDLEEYMISENGEVALAYYDLNVVPYTDIANDTISKIMSDVKEKVVSPEGLEYYWTGDATLNYEEHQSVNKSMDVTVVITIVMVMTILLIIYRAPLAALIPLITIGTSYTISKGVVGLAAMKGLGISSFTDTFLIAVLFGAGTDYCMLIVSRYKESLATGITPSEAIVSSMQRSGEAIFSSGGTVMIGFVCMLFAKFGLFSSTGPSVAIGVGITIIAVLTLVPSLLSIFGKAVFWPIRRLKVQNGDGIWSRISKTVTSKPVRFVIISFIIFAPFIFMTSKLKYSYDQIKDLPSENGSIKGFEIMKEGFAEGTIMPVKVTVNTNSNLWKTASLTYIDEMCDDLVKLDAVDSVMTATRPTGEKLTKTTIGSQLKKISKGMVKLGDGSAKLVTGMKDMKKGNDRLKSGIDKGADGFKKMSDSLVKLSAGLSRVNNGISKITYSVSSLNGGLKKNGSGLVQLERATNEASEGIKKSSAALLEISRNMGYYASSNPTLTGDAGFQKMTASISEISKGLEKINGGLDRISSGIRSSKGGNDKIVSAVTRITGGLNSSVSGINRIKSGINAVQAGQMKAARELKLATVGIGKLSTGSQDALDGTRKLDKGNIKLKDALRDNILSNSAISNVFNLPQSVIDSNDKLRDAMKEYISKDKKGIVLDVVLKNAPYDETSIDAIKDIKMVANLSLVNTPLENSEVKVGGVTSAMSDVKGMIDRDFTIVMISVLTGIFIILALMLRSIVAPIYLIVSILISYACTMGLTTIMFEYILGGDGVHWAVPFFSFCILVALGIDYNIFLMSRIKEEYTFGNTRQAVARALASTGGIITSCGIIMMGTFGAMLISPVRPIVQIGFTAVVGLFLDTFIVRTLVVPAIVTVLGEGSWWPGNRKDLKRTKIH